MDQANQTCCWDTYGPSYLRARFLKLIYKLPRLEQLHNGVAEINLRQISMVQGHEKANVLRYFQDSVSTLNRETIEALLASVPLDYQHHIINGLTKSQATDLRSCITRKYSNWCDVVRGLHEGKSKVSNVCFCMLLLSTLTRILFTSKIIGLSGPHGWLGLRPRLVHRARDATG